MLVSAQGMPGRLGIVCSDGALSSCERMRIRRYRQHQSYRPQHILQQHAPCGLQGRRRRCAHCAVLHPTALHTETRYCPSLPGHSQGGADHHRAEELSAAAVWLIQHQAQGTLPPACMPACVPVPAGGGCLPSCPPSGRVTYSECVGVRRTAATSPRS